MKDLFWKDTTELAELIRNKMVSPVEVLQAHLDRIAAVNPKVNSVLTFTEDAMDRAQAAEQAVMSGKKLGPLHGVPFTLKDTFDTAGVRTTVGSLIYKNNVPKTDSTVAARLKRAGAILVGKSNTPEFAMDAESRNRVFGQTNNPWDLARTPAGSSGGAAAALASGMTPFEVGSDVGGSIRVPATFCGVVGFKPTHGRVPLTGHNPAAMLRYMHIGPMTRTVRDNALILKSIAGADGHDPYAVPVPVPALPDLDAPLSKLRIAFSPEDGYAPVAKEVQAVITKATAALGEQGCAVEQVELPWLRKRDYLQEGLKVMLMDTVRFARPVIKGHESELCHNTKFILEWDLPTFEQYLTIEFDYIGELRRDAMAFFSKYDVLIGPSSTVAAPPHGGKPLNVDGKTTPFFHVSKNTSNWDMTGSPALSVPFGWSRDGRLPIGVQLIGPHFTESTILRVGAALERAAEGRSRRPPL
ncbi:MAG: amidase [SAR202 cluster bacterium]|nr:amidase [SAR202 cluster bacterium]